MEIYKCSKGFKYTAWLAIIMSPLAHSANLKPRSEDDLLIMETATPELNQVVTLKSTTENGKFKFFTISPYLKGYAKEVEGTINQQNYLVYFSKKVYEEYLNNKIMEIGNIASTEPRTLVNRYFANGSYKSLVVNPYTKRIIISADHLKVSPTFNIIHKKMYLPYLEKVEQQTVENLIDGAKTTISSKKQQSLRFYYYSIYPLAPDTELVFSVDSNVYNVPQYELIKHMVEDHKDMVDPSSTVTIPLAPLKDFMIIPF
jgi:hypothetical protein